MKTICIVSLLYILVLCISSCNTSTIDPIESTNEVESVSDETSTADSTKEDFMVRYPSLEPDKQDLPSYADLCKIEPGMTTDEVYQIAGNPQRTEIRMMPVSPSASLAFERTCYVYDSSDGRSVYVAWAYTESDPTLRVSVVLPGP